MPSRLTINIAPISRRSPGSGASIASRAPSRRRWAAIAPPTDSGVTTRAAGSVISAASSSVTLAASGCMISRCSAGPTVIRRPLASSPAGSRQTSATSPRNASSAIASMPATPGAMSDALDSVRLAWCRNSRSVRWRISEV